MPIPARKSPDKPPAADAEDEEVAVVEGALGEGEELINKLMTGAVATEYQAYVQAALVAADSV